MTDQPDQPTPDRHIEVYKDKADEHRWRLVSKRGNLPDEILADSGEGYVSMSNAKRAASSVHPSIPIIEVGE